MKNNLVLDYLSIVKSTFLKEFFVFLSLFQNQNLKQIVVQVSLLLGLFVLFFFHSNGWSDYSDWLNYNDRAEYQHMLSFVLERKA